jgi:hypothetical protein
VPDDAVGDVVTSSHVRVIGNQHRTARPATRQTDPRYRYSKATTRSSSIGVEHPLESPKCYQLVGGKGHLEVLHPFRCKSHTLDLFEDDEDDYEESEPEVSWDISCNPAWTPPLRNFNVGKTAYRWYRVEYYTGDHNVEIQECGYPLDDRQKPEPEWLENEHPHDFFSAAMEAETDYRDKLCQYTWALRHGVSPGQPFLIAFQEPRYSGGGRDYFGEYDDVEVDYQYDIVRRLPRTERAAMLAWEHVLKRIREADQRYERRMEHFRRMRIALTHRWQIEIAHFGQNNEIIELRLVARCSGDRAECLASGRSGDSYLDAKRKEPKDCAQAFWRLVEMFIERYPGVSVNPVLRLAGYPPLERHQIEVSRWDYLRFQYGEDHPELGPVDELL